MGTDSKEWELARSTYDLVFTPQFFKSLGFLESFECDGIEKELIVATRRLIAARKGNEDYQKTLASAVDDVLWIMIEDCVDDVNTIRELRQNIVEYLWTLRINFPQ